MRYYWTYRRRMTPWIGTSALRFSRITWLVSGVSSASGRTKGVRDVRYYRLPFKGYIGITHGYPLPPTLFNVVVDIVIRH